MLVSPDRVDGVGQIDPRRDESPEFLSHQLITYLGNKRALLGPIADAMDQICTRLGRDRLRILDGFSGSGIVSRYLKRFSAVLVTNDLEPYAEAISRCFLANRSAVDDTALREALEQIERSVDLSGGPPGFIERLYAPCDDDAIERDDRVFYTKENARKLDRYRSSIGKLPPALGDLLLGPLLSEASVHANTAGVFKGFYKNRETGIGAFGGSGRNALSRIRGAIVLRPPVLSRYECEVDVRHGDTNVLVADAGHFDVAYLDPPYNQHPYGSNYFMLNLVARYAEPGQVSPVAGIPVGWNRSRYNVRRLAADALEQLIGDLDATFVLLAYNDEGFVSPTEMRVLLRRFGAVCEVRTQYNAFRGSRNLANRERHVTEHLFMLDRSRRARG
jgi:adenine-specific DNA-methyltransferase